VAAPCRHGRKLAQLLEASVKGKMEADIYLGVKAIERLATTEPVDYHHLIGSTLGPDTGGGRATLDQPLHRP